MAELLGKQASHVGITKSCSIATAVTSTSTTVTKSASATVTTTAAVTSATVDRTSTTSLPPAAVATELTPGTSHYMPPHLLLLHVLARSAAQWYLQSNSRPLSRRNVNDKMCGGKRCGPTFSKLNNCRLKDLIFSEKQCLL